MHSTHWTVWVAFLLGLVVLYMTSRLGGGIDESDESMKWEAGVALGFGILIFAGPFWLGQFLFTVIGGWKSPDSRLWLWGWFFGVILPLVPGLHPLFVPLDKVFAWVSDLIWPPKKPVPPDFGARAVMDAAWADFSADGWRPCLSVPLPMAWPPIKGEPVVWYCYAERTQLGLVDGVEIGAPWARLMLVKGESQPTLKQLLDAIEPLGIQGVRPLDASQLNASRDGESLAKMIRRADGADEEIIAGILASWRGLNGRISSHPVIAAHFPPR